MNIKMAASSLSRPCFFVMTAVFLLSGCGYTTRSLLPSNFKMIRVDNFKDDIKVYAEQSNVRMYRGYRPGMETDITKAIINRFLLDGTLKIASESNADLILKGELRDYSREPLRYSNNSAYVEDNNVEEYRIKLLVDIELINARTGEVMWTEKGFTGETTYFTVGGLAISESAAIVKAEDDLARRIVERTVEVW